ncbi:MAG TPA: arginine--tRNA ligase, partial [Syntrophomonas sp.]|nr:arginine--tRNA ligase [Syntrophomonas sp.]
MNTELRRLCMNPIQELKDSLQQALVHALEYARDEGAINYEQVPEFVIEVPADKGHGDFAANIAMLLARQARMAPRKIAELIVRHLTMAQPVEKV